MQYAFTNHLSVQSLMERLLKDINYQLNKKGRKLYWVEHDEKYISRWIRSHGIASQAIETATELLIFGIPPTEREAGVPYQQIVAWNRALKGGPNMSKL